MVTKCVVFRFQTMDKDKSGVVDYTEFCEVLQVDPAPLCERTFGLYDYDKTGQIDAREVRESGNNKTEICTVHLLCVV